MDGSGDTPGPNHRTNIGRTWVSAQLLGGEGIVVVDVRSPPEWVAGTLPGAICIPSSLLAAHTGMLPTDERAFVAVCDAIGGDDAAAAAEALRAAGWPRARRLVGGFAEWIEEGEEVAALAAHGFPAIGDSVALPDGRSGLVWRIDEQGGEPRYAVLVNTGTSVADLTAGDLR
jgi:rhodanese-related sulfurtransferase